MTMSAYVDEGKCLVFPTMCDAYIHLEYGKHNMNTNNGIWNINGSFTGQFVLKPYDVNGYGDNTQQTNPDLVANGGVGNITNKKTMPSIADNVNHFGFVYTDNQDQKYLPNEERYTHSMCLFHNTNITVKLTVNGVETILESGNIMTSRKYHYSDTSKARNQVRPDGTTVNLFDDYHTQFVYDRYKIVGREAGQPPFFNVGNEYVEGWQIKYTPSSTPSSGFDTNSNMSLITIYDPTGDQPTPLNSIPIGSEMFNEDGVLLGKVAMIIPKGGIFTHHSIVFEPLPAGSTIPTFRDTAKVYVPVHREPMYIHSSTHIAIGYEQTTRRMSIFVNGLEVATTTHGATTGSFSLHNSDIYIGQNATLSYPNNRKTQFMGEFESILFTDTYMTNFTHMFNTVAPFESTVLYYDFSEGRDNG